MSKPWVERFLFIVHRLNDLGYKKTLRIRCLSLGAQSRHHCINSRIHGTGISVVFPVIKDARRPLNVGSDLNETCSKVSSALVLAKRNKSIPNIPIALAKYPPNHRITGAASDTGSQECRGPPTKRLEHTRIMPGFVISSTFLCNLLTKGLEKANLLPLRLYDPGGDDIQYERGDGEKNWSNEAAESVQLLKLVGNKTGSFLDPYAGHTVSYAVAR